MDNSILKQEKLNPNAPGSYSKKLTIRRLLSYGFEKGRLFFQYDRDGPDDTETLKMDFLNLDVRGDTEFFLRLNPQNAWRWSRQFHAITTKKPYTHFYGDLLYDRNGTFEEWDERSPKDWDCMLIRFLAAYNDADKSDKNHSFSMNIDLIMPDGAILPITLDPDIKNPPPESFHGNKTPIPGFLSAALDA